MVQFNCILIEDEPLAVEVMEGYIKEVPFLNLIRVCNDAVDALNFLRRTKVDLIFLDIHLPKLDGMALLKTLHAPPKIIITSAYNQYAIEGYEHDVVDYLLKPISFTRFLMAVNKLNFNKPHVNESSETFGEPASMFFNVNKKKVKIYLNEIQFIESQKEYIKIYTTTQTILTKMPLNEIEAQLPEKDFLRVHRSFIVAKNKIDAFTATDIEIKGKQIPIGRSYKELVVSYFNYQ